MFASAFWKPKPNEYYHNLLEHFEYSDNNSDYNEENSKEYKMLNKMKLIKNQESHRFVISSHPSPLSAHNKFKHYDCFMNTDHFGLINNHIKDLDKINGSNKDNTICWEIL